MTKIKNSHQNNSKSKPYLLSIFNENYNNFLLYLSFFLVQMGPVSKIKSSQLRLELLFQNPLIKGWLLVKQFWSKLISNYVFLAFLLFFILSDNFFDFGPIFKCHTQRMERINWMQNFLLNLLKNNSLKEIKYSRSLPDPENYWCVYQYLYNFGFCRFLDTSGWLRKTKISLFKVEKLVVTIEKIFSQLSQKKVFLEPINKKKKKKRKEKKCFFR